MLAPTSDHPRGGWVVLWLGPQALETASWVHALRLPLPHCVALSRLLNLYASSIKHRQMLSLGLASSKHPGQSANGGAELTASESPCTSVIHM